MYHYETEVVQLLAIRSSEICPITVGTCRV